MTFRRFLPLLPALLLVQCRTDPSDDSGGAAMPSSSGETQQIINVSSYDPKERQREGRSYSEHDVSALVANGSRGLIARAGKGGSLDVKCSAFLASSDRVGMMPGVYYRVQRHVGAVAQADQFVDRILSLKRERTWNSPHLLVCGDYDGDLSLSAILAFKNRVESRLGIVPVSYLENSEALKKLTSNADPSTKAKLSRGPYWLALYSNEGAPDPQALVQQYNCWPDWVMWQYGGVLWENGRSRPKVYSHGRYQNTLYFGDLDRPVERNVFRGSPEELATFWARHGVALR